MVPDAALGPFTNNYEVRLCLDPLPGDVVSTIVGHGPVDAQRGCGVLSASQIGACRLR